jgi:5S rRNA maturation endonuclease (ribonuclease M5)
LKKYDEVVNWRAGWFMRLEKAFHDLDAGQAEGICRIPRKIYEAANPKEQIRLLKMMLDELMAKANVQKGKNLHCPFHDDRSPSMIWKNGSLHCFACHDPGETRDIFDLIGLLFGLKSFAEKKIKAVELFVEDGTSIARAMRLSTKMPFPRSEMRRPASASRSFAAFKEWRYVSALEDEECRRYMEKRGIAEGSALRFHLQCGIYQNLKYLAIPCEGEFIVARNLSDDGPKIRLKKGVPVTLFNAGRLEMQKSCVFVVEGAIDAITIEQLGYGAIALNGLHFRKLIEKSHMLRRNEVFPMILLDNDEDGRKAGTKLFQELQWRGVGAYLHDYRGALGKFLARFKDVNEAYLKNPEETGKAIREIFQMASELSRIRPADPKDVQNFSWSNPLFKYGKPLGKPIHFKEDF